MGTWADFDRVTSEALDQVLEEAGLAVGDGAGPPLAEELLAAYRSLPPFADVAAALGALEADRPRAILTNGRRSTVEATVLAAGLVEALPVVLSVDDVGVYKPAPPVYGLAAHHFGLAPDRVVLVSGNGWDCAGAAAFGLRTIRVRRSGSAVAEPVGPPPDRVIDDLATLRDALASLD